VPPAAVYRALPAHGYNRLLMSESVAPARRFSRRQHIAWRLQRRLVPGLRPSSIAFYEKVEKALAAGPDWLDLGCGRQLVPEWFSPADYRRFAAAVERAHRVVGFDFDEASLRDNQLPRKVRGDAYALPFANASFNLVTANLVMEHLARPRECLVEIHRVLKPGGVLIFHTPNVASPLMALAALTPGWIKKPLARLIEDRREEDVFPTRYRLNTSDRIREDGAALGFTVREIQTVCTSPLTQVLGPGVIPELLLIRLMQASPLAPLRPNIVAVLEKRARQPNGS